MQRLRDNPACADQEYQSKADADNPGLSAKLSYNPDEDVAAPYIAVGTRPKLLFCVNKVLIATWKWRQHLIVPVSTIDVHMSDLIEGRHNLVQFKRWSLVAVSLTVTC